MGKSKTKNQKKLRATADHTAEEEFSSVPHSFVFHRGQIGKNTQQLILDVRRAMEPFTATSLKVRKKNALKDFVAVAGPLGVTHFLIFSKTPASVNFKFVRLPRGPTLSFKVTQYALMKDVVSTLKKHRMHEQQFTQPPLLVLNNFGTQGMQVKLMATMFQNMFPSINVHKVNLNTIKRCILINYNSDTQLIDFRHYSLKVVPVGMSKGMKKLLQEKFPNMSRWDDISELLIKGANLSESEAEQDGDHNITELPQAYAGRGNMKAQQSAVRLTEIGPRMTLQLVKIEEGLSDGKVLYHNYIEKTEEQIKGMLERKEKKLRQKAERRKKQEGDVKNKKQERDDNKKRSLAGMKRKCGADQDDDSGAEDPGTTGEQDQSEDDDAEYYRQEVGQEPDRDLFLHGSRKKFPNRNSGPPRKKFRGATEPRRAGQESHSPGGPTGQRRGKSPLQRGDKSPWGQKPRPGKKPMGQKAWQNPEGQRPRPGKRPMGQKAWQNPEGERPRPGKRPMGQKAWQNPEGERPRPGKIPMGQKAWQNPEGQRPRPGKKPVGQKGRQNAEGQRPRKNAATRGFKKNFEFKRPGAFGSRSSRPGQKPKAGGRHKTGERKGGKPPKQKRKGF